MKTSSKQPMMKQGSRLALLHRFLAISAVGIVLTGQAQAIQSTWTGGGSVPNWSDPANWGGSVAFGSGNTLYFASSGSTSTTVRINNLNTIGALIFGPETAGSGAISIIGNNNTITLDTVLGSTLGLTGDLANANIGLWVQAGAGANGLYANNTATNTPSKSQVGVPVMISKPNTVFLNESSSDFYLDARLRGTTGGSLILQKGSWVIDYVEVNSSGNGTSQLSGGITIEDAKLTVNVAGGTTGAAGTSPLAQGPVTLGLAGSDKDAVLVFTEIDRNTASNRLTTSSGNLINVSDGTGRRVIQNGNASKKELYSSLTINGSATLTLDNHDIDGAVMEISADAAGVGASNDLQTGVRGTGNLYLTGGGTFYTKAGLVVAENGVRNSFTGETTVHQGVLQFREGGGFQKSSVIRVDKNGVLDVSQAAGGSYVVGDSAYLGAAEHQTLTGTGQVTGTVILGAQSVLRAGGADAGAYRAALTFSEGLALGPLTIADIGSGYYGAVDTLGSLIYGGELRITLAAGFTAGGIYDLFNFASLGAGDFASVSIYSGTSLLGNLALGEDEFANVWLGNVNGQDYAFDQVNGALTVGAVPEPGTVALVGFGLAGLIAWSRRAARRSASE